MAWITPVTNRISTSKYNIGDTNRVDNNTEYLADYIETNLGITTVFPYAYATAIATDWGTADLINGLEANINETQSGLGATPIGWVTLNEDWVAGDYDFIYTNANNLEQNLILLKASAENVVASVRYCGTFSAGDIWGELFTDWGIM